MDKIKVDNLYTAYVMETGKQRELKRQEWIKAYREWKRSTS